MKKVFLTIDDSPSPMMGEKIDILLEYNIPAIFFSIGEHMEAFPGAMLDALKNGFVIGNHSYSHPHFSDLSNAEMKNEVLKTEKIINDLYAESGIERRTKYFRFPYGDKGDGLRGRYPSFWRKQDKAKKKEFQNFLQESGFQKPPKLDPCYHFYKKAFLDQDIDWHWTFDTLDYDNTRSDSFILERLSSEKANNPLVSKRPKEYWLSAGEHPEIILIHDHEDSHDRFLAIIKTLIQQDLDFQTMEFAR